jgi:predicted secreted hydrolase
MSNDNHVTRGAHTIWLVLPVLVLASVVAWALWPKPPQPLQARIVAASIPPSSDGFDRADGSRPLTFPADHGPHADYETEWWYYTGNLTAQSGEHFGYQLTFFRRALVPPTERAHRASAWGTDQVYMAHLALTDVSGRKHSAFERLSRGAAGLAGAQADPYSVWIENWSVTGQADGGVQLRANDGEIALSLVLHDLTGPIPQGDHGYSRKGPEPGNASYYYSLPRIATEGVVTASGHTYNVQGLSWMDHEFSTSALGPGQIGWDWFSLQLDDGSELMLYQLRNASGSRGQFSGGTLIAADGAARRLGVADFSVQTTGEWRSPRTQAVYPAGWILTVPGADLRLTVIPYLADQEMNVSYTYWEGAVKASGSAGGRAVAGSGYVELTGYARAISF